MHMAECQQCPFFLVTRHDWSFGVEFSAPQMKHLAGKVLGQCCKIWVFDFSEIPMKLEFEFNGFSRPVLILRKFFLVTGWVFRHIFHGFDPKTTQKCYTLPRDVDSTIENNTTTFWKSGFLSTSISINQRSFSSFVNENHMPLVHRSLVCSFHAANSSFKPTFSECRIILNFRSILFVPLRSLHENYFVWALHHFCKLQNLSSFKTDQFLWNIISFVPRRCRMESWIRPLNGGVRYSSTHTTPLTRPINLSWWNACVFYDCWFNQPRLLLSVTNCFNPHKQHGWCH